MMETILANLTVYEDNINNNSNSNRLSPTTLSDADATSNSTRVDSLGEDDLLVWIVVDGLLMIAILFGNTLTILAVTLSRRLSSLISNHFVLNLAVSDLTVGLTLPYHLAFYLNSRLGKTKETCVLRFMLIMLACSASILNLIAIAVDRYIAILHPLHYSRYMTKTLTRTLMVVAWTLAVSASVVPLFWNNWGSMAHTCEVHKIIPKEYSTNVLAPLFSLVWVVMFVLYWRIWREAAMHARRMRTTTCSQSAGPNDWKSVQVVLMVLGSFSICWMPYVVVVCTQTATSYKTHDQILYKAVFSLAVANSGINPVIYAWKNTGFRRAFLRLLRFQSPDCPEFERSFRNNTPSTADRKLPLEAVVAAKPEEPKKPPANNNCVDSDHRCRIIENMAYEDGARLAKGADKCHIIENLGFDDGGCYDGGIATNFKMIDSRESDNESVVTMPIANGNQQNGLKCSV